MKSIIAFAFVLVAVAAQEYQHPYGYMYSNMEETSDTNVAPDSYYLAPESYMVPESYTVPESYGAAESMDLGAMAMDPESVDPHGRFRRDLTLDQKIGNNGRVFGTVGQNDNGLFGRAGAERTIFNDARGRLDAQAHATRVLGPNGDASALGGSLNWKNNNAAASFDVSKQIHGPTSWSAAGGGRWPVGKNGDFGVDGTYSRMGGVKDYGARGVFNYRF